MISVILYGRNDAHGYNLHRRAALSLNCLAEVLDDANDEIIFVDYNTPDELPTLVEALSDTLTDRCLEVLRVLRVPAWIHEERFAGRTHLPAIEPVARNAGARRSNPANRWLLSTNTDMILLSLSGQSLSELCRELPDAFYGLPRFELPEWLWESLPRSDPRRAMDELAHFGPELRLDEPTVSHEWIRFDAPGDFQLMLREDFFAIDGFNEEMLLGWHVDSNLSRRMFIHRGSIQTLDERLAGYHCNHSRTPTVYHGEKWIANDWGRYFFSVDRAQLPAQRDTWGLCDAALEEVGRPQRAGASIMATVAATTADGPNGRTTSDALLAEFAVTYDSGHVLPFVADSLVVSPSDATIGYIGANPVLERMLATVVARLKPGGALRVVQLENRDCIDQLSRAADVFVVDLGVDLSLLDASLASPGSGPNVPLPASLVVVFDAFRRLVELERARLARGEHPRRFVLVNSSAAYWNAYVLAQLDCSPSTFHSRVRRATVRLLPDENATKDALENSGRFLRWSVRHEIPGRLHIGAGETVELGDLDDFRGFGAGWCHPEATAIWTQGSQAELAVAFDGLGTEGCFLDLSAAKVGTRSDELLKVRLLVNGAHASTRFFTKRNAKLRWRIAVPAHLLSGGEADLTFEVDAPASWSSDDRHLGLQLKALTVRRNDWHGRLDAVHDDSLTKLRARKAALRRAAGALRTRVHASRIWRHLPL